MSVKQVTHPTQTSRTGGIKQVKSSIIEGPIATSGNLTPYNRNGKGATMAHKPMK